jgi:hypothetical protein
VFNVLPVKIELKSPFRNARVGTVRNDELPLEALVVRSML